MAGSGNSTETPLQLAASVEQLAAPTTFEDSTLVAQKDDAGEEEGPFQMTFAADVAWTIFFSAMIVNAIIGNIVVFWIVLGKQDWREQKPMEMP